MFFSKKDEAKKIFNLLAKKAGCSKCVICIGTQHAGLAFEVGKLTSYLRLAKKNESWMTNLQLTAKIDDGTKRSIWQKFLDEVFKWTAKGFDAIIEFPDSEQKMMQKTTVIEAFKSLEEVLIDLDLNDANDRH